MDKKTVLLASACTLLMISCSNDAELINVAETTGLQTKAFVGEADFQIVDYAGDKCIQFKNDSVFNAMLWEMNDMSEEERNNILGGRFRKSMATYARSRSRTGAYCRQL